MSETQQVASGEQEYKQLRNLCPIEAGFTLEIDGVDIDFTLRKYDMFDANWGAEKYGKNYEGVVNDFSNHLVEFATLLFRLINEKDHFKPFTVKDWDDDGNRIEIKMTAPLILLKAMKGTGKLVEVYQEFLKCVGHSEALQQKQVTNSKKSKHSKKKKS